MKTIKQVLEELYNDGFDTYDYTGKYTEKKLKLLKKDSIDQALKEIESEVNLVISDVDRLYTDEYDRKLWNEFKYKVQDNIKKVIGL